jgi:hypothetical protein
MISLPQGIGAGGKDTGFPLELLKSSKYEAITITPASNITGSSLGEISHSLGVQPRYVVLLASIPYAYSYSNAYVVFEHGAMDTDYTCDNPNSNYSAYYWYYGSGASSSKAQMTFGSMYCTDETVSIGTGNAYLKAGYEYTLVLIA